MTELENTSFELLIELSSLGTEHAHLMRARTPRAVSEHLLGKITAPAGCIAELTLLPELSDLRATDRRLASLQAQRADNNNRPTRPGKVIIIMSDNNDRHVVPNSDGGWDVVKPNASRASSHHDTQADAQDRAREIVHNAGGGEVVTHGRDGRIRDSDTIAPGNDPFPPRDRK